MKHTTGNRATTVGHGAEASCLVEFSARIGRDPLLVQASSGNTSIKLGDTLWIKASGKWLANANREEIFVPVDLARAQHCLSTDGDLSGLPGTGLLRPSIETAMHVALPHRVVAHVHSINTIAWAVRKDAQQQLAERLAGLNWRWIPYTASGTPLAREIEKSLYSLPQANVFVLANHGLVVCGDDCLAVETLLLDIEHRLAIHPRKSPPPEAALSLLIARSQEWFLPTDSETHALGTDAVATKILQDGVLFPCQAIFLGPQVRMLPRSVPLSRFPDYSNGRNDSPTFVVVDGGGVILYKRISDAQRAILIGLSQVIQRVDPCAPIRYLTAPELADLFADGPHPYLAASASEGGASDSVSTH